MLQTLVIDKNFLVYKSTRGQHYIKINCCTLCVCVCVCARVGVGVLKYNQLGNAKVAEKNVIIVCSECLISLLVLMALVQFWSHGELYLLSVVCRSFIPVPFPAFPYWWICTCFLRTILFFQKTFFQDLLAWKTAPCSLIDIVQWMYCRGFLPAFETFKIDHQGPIWKRPIEMACSVLTTFMSTQWTDRQLASCRILKNSFLNGNAFL